MFEIDGPRRAAGMRSNAFEQNGSRRQSQPKQYLFLWTGAGEDGEGEGDPKTQAVEAIEELPPETRAGGAPQSRDDAEGSVFR